MKGGGYTYFYDPETGIGPGGPKKRAGQISQPDRPEPSREIWTERGDRSESEVEGQSNECESSERAKARVRTSSTSWLAEVERAESRVEFGAADEAAAPPLRGRS